MTTHNNEAAERELMDDGENRAVRWFLALYGGMDSPTNKQMRDHLSRCGYPYWPEWAARDDGHLTKGGAQDWLRHLFSLETASEAPATEQAPAGEVPHLIYYDDRGMPVEMVIGSHRAQERFRQISGQWNAHLFVKIKSNSRDDPYHHMNAALSTPPAVPPEGWKWMPEKLTVEMALALHGRDGIEQAPGITCVSDETARIYADVLSAAPAAPQTKEQQ